MNSKKLLALLLSGLLALTMLSACTVGEENKPDTKTESTQTQTGENKEETSTKTETAENEVVTPVVKDDQVDFSSPKKLDTLKVLGDNLKEMNKILGESATTDINTGKNGDENTYVKTMLAFYEVGTLKADPYQGQKLLVMIEGCEGPCFSDQISRFAWDEQSGKLTYLTNHSYSDYIPEFLNPVLKNSDKELTLKALILPNSIMLPDGSNSVQLVSKDVDFRSGMTRENGNEDGTVFVDLGKVAFTDPKVGPVYLSALEMTGCVFVIGPDSVISTYKFDPDLVGDKAGDTVKWNDGTGSGWFGVGYDYMTGGCGIGNSCYNVENTDASQLVEVGQTQKGTKIFVAKNNQRIEDKTDLDGLVDKDQPQWALNYYYNLYVDMQQYLPDDSRAAKVKTYEEFLAEKPIVYWQDPFGRYSGIIATEFKAPAECGKPVIYLYPEKTSSVSVKVGIDEFTVTEPAYGNGWNVMAEPNGDLTNLADGKQYEYLFWEGKSAKQLSMNSGSVVAKADLEGFLKDSLTKLGLNEKESAEFREFWVPKMMATSEPYVLVSFVGATEFNKIAPLTIEPKPDTVIRVFMYYQPLWQKIEMPAQTFTALPRKGFTVVEWGGTSSDGWQIR